MGRGIIVIGKSGTGKSRSIKSLSPDSTFLINTIDKPVPFRGSDSLYRCVPEQISQGNLFITPDITKIRNIILKISESMPHIKVIVLDDFQFTMSEVYFNLTNKLKLNEIFEVYRTLARNNKLLFQSISELRPDLFVYVLSHSDIDEEGFHKMKIIGKLTEKEYAPEATVAMIFHSLIVDGHYRFLTRNDGKHLGKCPEGMFDSDYIDNDLGMIDKVIREYFA